MSEENRKTLESYEKRSEAYIHGTPQIVTGAVKRWLDQATEALPKTARILELGSAFGRDAIYLEKQGYQIACTDACESFVALLRTQGHHKVFRASLPDDPLGGPYDLIFANAVLLHLTRDAFAKTLSQIAGALSEQGRFAMTLKRGAGEVWTNEKLQAPRYFCYWELPALLPLLGKAGFERWSIDTDNTGHGSAEWLHIVAHKGACS